MTYTLQVKQQALDAARDAYFYYEEKQQGLGERFLAALQRRFQQLSKTPQHYSYISADKERSMRDVKLEGFPYVIIYDIVETNVVIYTIRSTYKRPK